LSEVFDEYAQYYDALYADKNYGEEARYLDALINQHSIIPVPSVLEFGAGSGKLQLALLGLGYDVTSVDLSPRMVAQAGKLGAKVEQGDIRDHQLEQKFDAVVAFFHVISYLTTDEDLEKGISNALSHLKPGGVFIFDVWFKDAVLAQKPEVRIKRVAHEGTEIVRIAEPSWDKGKDTVEVSYQLFVKRPGQESFGSFSEQHLLRYFSKNQVLRLSAQHDVALVAMEETITREDPDSQTWGVTVVLLAIPQQPLAQKRSLARSPERKNFTIEEN